MNLRKTYGELYAASTKPAFVKVPELAVFAVDGRGDPRREGELQARMELLYSASYALKFALKRGRGLDWTVMPPEGDWWCANMAEWSMERREAWIWRLIIVQPSEVSEAEAFAAIEATRKKRAGNPALPSLRFERRPAHEAAQILHLGPYAAEGRTVELLHAFIAEAGLGLTGEHREIYLSDPRRGLPEKMKTIIRQPVKR